MNSLLVFEDFLLAKELQGVSPNTLLRYHYSIEKLLTELGDADIQAISTTDIRRRLSKKTYGQVSLGMDIKNLKTFFRWTCLEGYRDDDPMIRVPMPKTPERPCKAICDADMAKLINVAKRSKRDLSILLCLLDTACRATELAKIELSEVDFQTGTIRIKCGKGGKSRNVFISPLTARAIRVYLNSRHDNDPSLFISQRGVPLNRDSLRLIMYRLCERAGIKKFGPHAVRHSAATSMARQGIDSWSLQQLLGHADNRVSLRYIWLSSRNLQEAHQKYSPVSTIL